MQLEGDKRQRGWRWVGTKGGGGANQTKLNNPNTYH